MYDITGRQGISQIGHWSPCLLLSPKADASLLSCGGQKAELN